MKTCVRCGKTKPINKFLRNSRSTYRRSVECKLCHWKARLLRRKPVARELSPEFIARLDREAALHHQQAAEGYTGGELPRPATPRRSS